MTNNTVPADSAKQSVPVWNNLPQNPTGVDFTVLCEDCPFLLDDGSCRRDRENKNWSSPAYTYTLSKSGSVSTMPMSLGGMMKSYEQARAVLGRNPQLKVDPEGGELSLDESLQIDGDGIVKAKRKLALTRLAVWSNPIGWYVDLLAAVGDKRGGFVARAKANLNNELEKRVEARGTVIGVEVLSQIVRLNCARVNRANLEAKELAGQIATGQVWVLGSEELLDPEKLR